MLSFFCPPQLAEFSLPDEVKMHGVGLSLYHNSMSELSQIEVGAGFWSQDLSPLEVLSLVDRAKTLSVIQSVREYFSQDVLNWIKLRKNSANYFADPLRASLCEIEASQVFEYSNGEDKQSLRDQIEAFSTQYSNQACVDSVLILFEELFMNATIDAPREAEKNSVHLTAHEKYKIRFHLGVDANRIVIASEDPYGSLNPKKLISRMVQVYSQGAGEAINLHSPGGAGIGCVLMFENSSILTIGVKKNQMTIVSCTVYRHLNRRQREAIKKSLHIIYQD